MTCREAFGAAINLTGSQFAVLVGVAYRAASAERSDGFSWRNSVDGCSSGVNDYGNSLVLLPDIAHHVTTDVGGNELTTYLV
jgi:hypothetical protein